MAKLQVEKGIRIFERYLNNLGYRQSYIKATLFRFEDFLSFLRVRQIEDIREVDKTILLEYFNSLEKRTSKLSGESLARGTKGLYHSTVKLFFRGLYFEELLLVNPMQDLNYKPGGEIVKRNTLSMEEMNRLLDSIEDNDFLGIRDRAIFELMYSSGLRDGEIANLNLEDIDFESRVAIIREGKFSKDRIVPVSKVAVKFVKRYVNLQTLKRDALFLGNQGTRLTGAAINRRFKHWLEKAELYQPGLTAHSVRHSTAIHLLSQGADLRYVQELLGHESIETTVTYTHELEDQIKRIYKSYHPRENTSYRDIDPEYLKRLMDLKTRLEKARAYGEKKLEIKKRYYEKNREKILRKLRKQ